MFMKLNFCVAAILILTFDFNFIQGHCPLVNYENNTVALGLFPGCLEPFPVKIAEDFLPTFNLMVQWSKQCKVKMVICRSFRSSPFPLAEDSHPNDLNHFIGHAVDINLMTADGYCGAFCIHRKLHKGVRCFLRKVKLGGLRWGGDNPNLCAPTQFDDARFESDPSIGNSLLQQINQECEYFGYIDL